MHLLPRFQATGGTFFEELGDDQRLQFATVTNNDSMRSVNYTNQQIPVATIVTSTTNHQQHPQQQQQQQSNKMNHSSTTTNNQGGGGGYYPTAIHANYAIAPAPQQNSQSGASAGTIVGGTIKGSPQTLVVQRHVGQQKLFSVGGPSN